MVHRASRLNSTGTTNNAPIIISHLTSKGIWTASHPVRHGAETPAYADQR